MIDPAALHNIRQGDDSIMEALTSILSQRSTSFLVEPGPDSTDLHTMLTAAIHATDHGRCRPWRFVVFKGEDKAASGLVLEKAYLDRCENHNEKINPDQRFRERNRLTRAPVVVTVICRSSRSGKVPQSAATHAGTCAGVARKGGPYRDRIPYRTTRPEMGVGITEADPGGEPANAVNDQDRCRVIWQVSQLEDTSSKQIGQIVNGGASVALLPWASSVTGGSPVIPRHC